MFGKTTFMEPGEQLKGQFMKNIHNTNSLECRELHKTHVFYFWLAQGIKVHLTKTILLEIAWNAKNSTEI